MAIWLDSDTPLDRLLSGSPLDDANIKKIEREESLFKPTPFVPTQQTYIARFLRNRCAVCDGTQMVFSGFFLEKKDEKGTRDLIYLKPREINHEQRRLAQMDITDEMQPTCFMCFSERQL